VTETQEKMLAKKIRRIMSHMKTTGAVTGVVVAALLMVGARRTEGQAAQIQPAQSQTTTSPATGKLAPSAPVTYANKYEIYGGANFMNFQAGQNLPKRMNFVGWEALGTYWLHHKWGLGADVRGEYGTTPVFPNPYSIASRPFVSLTTLMGGTQYRGPKNQHAALNYHAYAGASHGTFDWSTNGVPPQNIGLYSNRTKFMAALGGSVDFNRSKKVAIRLQPDLILEHFGTETREFFAISGGVVYRFGNK
jgi:hypothetical protein